MKIFKSKIKAFIGTSKDYVIKEAVERANARLMGQSDASGLHANNVYARYQVERPSCDDIERAAAKAMRVA